MKITFDLCCTRFNFIKSGFQMIWAGIRGYEGVLFEDVECEEVTERSTGRKWVSKDHEQ